MEERGGETGQEGRRRRGRGESFLCRLSFPLPFSSPPHSPSSLAVAAGFASSLFSLLACFCSGAHSGPSVRPLVYICHTNTTFTCRPCPSAARRPCCPYSATTFLLQEGLSLQTPTCAIPHKQWMSAGGKSEMSGNIPLLSGAMHSTHPLRAVAYGVLT